MSARIGSLCSGVGGLDRAVEQVLDGRTVWHAETDPSASKVLAARWPGVPNLGDLTAVDWTAVEPVDVLTAGYPCGPFSLAGHRKGASDERHLWPYVADAVRVLGARGLRLVVLENVAGHVSLGLDAVVGDLAEIGWDAEWSCVRASDVGAPHRRERVFIVARPAADATDLGRERHGRARRRGVGPTDGGFAAADAKSDAGWLRDGDSATAADADSAGQRRQSGAPSGRNALRTDERNDPDGCSVVDWGIYGPAVARWECTLGRSAPTPYDGRGRLAPRFVEWMQGLPAGWVTNVVTSRTAALRMFGNAVVPQQAAWAVEGLLGRLGVAQPALPPCSYAEEMA